MVESIVPDAFTHMVSSLLIDVLPPPAMTQSCPAP